MMTDFSPSHHSQLKTSQRMICRLQKLPLKMKKIEQMIMTKMIKNEMNDSALTDSKTYYVLYLLPA